MSVKYSQHGVLERHIPRKYGQLEISTRYDNTINLKRTFTCHQLQRSDHKMQTIKNFFSKKSSTPVRVARRNSTQNATAIVNGGWGLRGSKKEKQTREIANLSKTDGVPRIIICLDETGSMGVNKAVTISSYNEWLDCNRKKNDDEDQFPRFTLVRFNTESELEEHKSVESAPRLTNENYKPDNCTALYDAIGRSINSYKDEKDNIMVILTDGEENSSRLFDRLEIKELIETYTEEHGWIFHYLGAAADSWSVGQTIGIRDAKFCTSYVADEAGFDHAWAENAMQMDAYRGRQARKRRGLSVESLTDMEVPRIDKASYLASRQRRGSDMSDSD